MHIIFYLPKCNDSVHLQKRNIMKKILLTLIASFFCICAYCQNYFKKIITLYDNPLDAKTSNESFFYNLCPVKTAIIGNDVIVTSSIPINNAHIIITDEYGTFIIDETVNLSQIEHIISIPGNTVDAGFMICVDYDSTFWYGYFKQ